MFIIVFFIFRLKLMYQLFGIPGAIYKKYQLLAFLLWASATFLFVVLCLSKSLYIQYLLIGTGVLALYDATNGGLVSHLHEAGVFGTWREAEFWVTFFVYLFVLGNMYGGPEQFCKQVSFFAHLVKILPFSLLQGLLQ